VDIAAQQRLLYAIAGSFLLGTTGAVYWSTSAIAPAAVTVDRRANSPAVTGREPAPTPAAGADDDLLRSLRAPLYDPPPTPPTAPTNARPVPRPKPTPPPRLNLTLVGTIIDPDQSLAIIADADGNFDVKGVGDSLELKPAGVRIGQIESEAITLQYQGKESTIRLEKEASRPTGGGRQGNTRRRNQ
jgi:hypothetical protein